MLGDEMGLGKSVEALAAMCHLRVEGRRHFLVVCPASVLVNWTHEIRRHSELEPHRLHGPDRERNLQVWARAGGVAVTTYDSLRSLRKPARVDLGMLVVDEAHYAKNMAAERTKAVRQWAAATSRVLFLTGTPMENRVEEFRVLVSHLQPALVPRISTVDGMIGAGHFRAAVAPVYLRRNQDDVLQELPPRVETEEWVELAGRDLEAYRDAVAAGNFMAMRRAAYAPGSPVGSAKLGRLVEIVEEASANGRKVVVFSYFRDVLDTVASVLGAVALGPLTGSAPPVHAAGHGRRVRRPPRPRGPGEPDPGRRSRPEHPGRLRRDPHRAAVEAHDRGPGDRPLPPHGPGALGRRAPPPRRGQRRPAHARDTRDQGRPLRRVRPPQRAEGPSAPTRSTSPT